MDPLQAGIGARVATLTPKACKIVVPKTVKRAQQVVILHVMLM